jgi:glyoxylase-like metal-dependent hydrolase (beta-lactamase superfamily II)
LKMTKINEHCYYFSSAVNIGYLLKDGKGLLIDTGLDDSSIKKVIRQLDERDLPLDYCFITHAHTDHFGGAAWLKKQKSPQLLAPDLEKEIIEHPLLEPLYLWNGSFPLNELRNKFLEGKPVTIDEYVTPGKAEIGPFELEFIPLPGHAIGQTGLLYEGVLFAADSYFGRDALQKHIIPFIVDASATLHTLESLKDMDLAGAVPGHGEYEQDLEDTIKANIDLHKNLLKHIVATIHKSEGKFSFEELFAEFLNDHGVEAGSIGQYLLYRTSFTAYLTMLSGEKSIKIFMENNRIYISE